MNSRSINVILAVYSLYALAGCASSARTPAGKETAPRVSIAQEGAVPAFGEVTHDTGIPMTYVLSVENPFDHDVTLTSVELETVGEAGGYSIPRMNRDVSETIPAATSREVRFRAWIRVLTESETRTVDHPVFVRGRARFDSPAGPMTRQFSARLNATGKTRREK